MAEPRPFRTDESVRHHDPHLDITLAVYHDDGSSLGERLDGARSLTIKAGYRGTKRIVPPAGEDYAFDRQYWAREVTVHVSPTGRSVRVWVDGHEIPPGFVEVPPDDAR